MVEKQGSNVLNVEKGQLHWFVCTVLLFGRCMYVARFNKFKSKPVTLLLISSCKPALRLIKHIQVTALLTEMAVPPSDVWNMSCLDLHTFIVL